MKTVVTAFRVLDELAKRQPVGVSEIARAMGMPKSTMYRVLKSLEKAGWARSSGGAHAQWVLTARPVILAQFVANDLGIREVARPAMEKLQASTAEAIHLAIPDGDEIVVIDQLDCLLPVRIYWSTGQHGSTHATANGKAILAFASEAQRDKLLPRELEAHTARTITSRTDLEKELGQIRARGWSTSFGEFRDEFGSIAAPILDFSRAPIASLSVFFPIHRTPTDGGVAWGRLVSSAAHDVANQLSLAQRLAAPSS